MIANAQKRQITLSGQDNFRDLGGYLASDGRRVKWRQLFRSGELCNLSDGDIEKLSVLGIRRVVDLRSKQEVESKGVARLPAGIFSIPLAIDPGNLAPMLVPAFARGDFQGCRRIYWSRSTGNIFEIGVTSWNHS